MAEDSAELNEAGAPPAVPALSPEERKPLYIVPTPIGNLQDITLRALQVLGSVDVVLAEDTRTSGQLLKHFNIKKPMKSFHIHNEHGVVAGLVARMQAGESMALVSDAGTPGISDPGYLIIREALKAGIMPEVLPGAVAFVPALLKSGLPADRFVFEGFLPHKKGRQTRLKELAEEPRTVILYESTHRLIKCLEQLAEHFGAERQASVSRELTKLHEETVNGTLSELLAYYQSHSIKGEIVIVIHGKA